MPPAPTLVSLDPPELLSFPLVYDTGPKLILHIKNISQSKIIFKVKTTQPSWYFVRPNQQILDINGSEEVIINLIAAECNRFLEMTEDEKDAALNRHRFLVQTKVITDEVYRRILEIPQTDRADEYQAVWEQADKDELKNHKLRVEFIVPTSSALPESTPSSSSSIQRTPNLTSSSSGPGAANDSTRTRPLLDTANTSRNTSSSAGAGGGGGGGAGLHDDIPGSPESIYAELQSLRKKYDAVVEYTVHLTAERDYHFTQLEELKKEVMKEKSKRKNLLQGEGSAAGSSNSHSGGDGGGANKKQVVVQHGYSFMMVILVAFISFFVARYTKG